MINQHHNHEKKNITLYWSNFITFWQIFNKKPKQILRIFFILNSDFVNISCIKCLLSVGKSCCPQGKTRPGQVSP